MPLTPVAWRQEQNTDFAFERTGAAVVNINAAEAPGRHSMGLIVPELEGPPADIRDFRLDASAGSANPRDYARGRNLPGSSFHHLQLLLQPIVVADATTVPGCLRPQRLEPE